MVEAEMELEYLVTLKILNKYMKNMSIKMGSCIL